MGLLDKVKDVFDGDDNDKKESDADYQKRVEEATRRSEEAQKEAADRQAAEDARQAELTKAREEGEAAARAEAEAKAAADAAAAQAAADQAAAEQAAAAAEETYTVQPGDTLGEIGARFGVDYHEIARVNGIENPDLIYPGQVFTIPR